MGRIRESDGLEPVLRLGALWQRVGVEPLRQTQQGTLYKRDQERIEEDPVLSGTINDALEPLAGLPALWLSLARRVGLIRSTPADDRLLAAGPEFWTENAVHLPQMIATSWLGLRELVGSGSCPQGTDPDDRPARRRSSGPPCSSGSRAWAKIEWVALDDLAEHLHGQEPGLGSAEPSRESRRPRSPPDAVPPSRAARRAQAMSRAARGQRMLGSLLLGAGLCLRAGPHRPRSKEDGRTVVQLTPLGRYVLAMGPPPPPRPAFEHFLFVQPNLEVIAYRQGLTPAARRPAQPVRLVDQDRRGDGAEADPGVDRPRPGGRSDPRADARDPDPAQPAPAPDRSWPTPSGGGPAAASRSPSTPPPP